MADLFAASIDRNGLLGLQTQTAIDQHEFIPPTAI
jgi:hypothetical protein